MRLVLTMLVFIETYCVAFAKNHRPEFARDILLILEKHCYECHDGKKVAPGWRIAA